MLSYLVPKVWMRLFWLLKKLKNGWIAPIFFN
jgi:hypothetical protein